MDVARPHLLQPASAGNDFLALFLSQGARHRHGDGRPTSRSDIMTPGDETGARLREHDPRARLAIWLELRPCGLLHWHDDLVAT